jgi:mxaA protein
VSAQCLRAAGLATCGLLLASLLLGMPAVAVSEVPEPQPAPGTASLAAPEAEQTGRGPAPVALPLGYSVTPRLRGEGYVVGDLLVQEVDLRTPREARLDLQSLPVPGRVNNWLEVRERLVVRGWRGGYRLRIVYQVFGVVESPQRLEVPAYTLRLQDRDAGLIQAPVPAQAFILSPVLPSTLGPEDRIPWQAPAPAPLPAARAFMVAGLCAALALLCLLYLGWMYDRLPFWQRAARPMTRLLRQLRWRRPGDLEEAPAYRALLEQVNRALNACAGETLYADRAAALFERAPWMRPLHDEIEAFLRHARAVLYGNADSSEWPVPRVLALCRSAQACERGRR